MKRSDLEHILRASKEVTGETKFIVIGSQAILGPFPDTPRELRQSLEETHLLQPVTGNLRKAARQFGTARDVGPAGNGSLRVETQF